METTYPVVARTEVLGVPVDCVDMATALLWVDHQVSQGDRARTLLAVNPEKVMACREDPRLHEVLCGAGLLIPDGIGVVLAVRLRQKQVLSRVAGADLMQEICRQASVRGHTVFIYGGRAEVNREAVLELRRRFPAIRIVGSEHGYIGEADQANLVEKINRSGAQILFVALGSPRQEFWMQHHLPRLQVKVCQGIGGTLDVIAGRVRRAPAVFIRLNLEWLYRLISQPGRLLRQTALPRFAWWIVRHKSSG